MSETPKASANVDPEQVAQCLRDLEGKEPSPREVRESVAYLQKIERRKQGDWSDFQYKFELTPRHEEAIRDYCARHSLDFEAEWRHFNDTREVASATTFPQMKAERQWHHRRVQPTSLDVFLRFMEALEVKVGVRKISGDTSHPSDAYMNAPIPADNS